MTSRDDRMEGVLLGTAAVDALGAPSEFGPATRIGRTVRSWPAPTPRSRSFRICCSYRTGR